RPLGPAVPGPHSAGLDLRLLHRTGAPGDSEPGAAAPAGHREHRAESRADCARTRLEAFDYALFLRVSGAHVYDRSVPARRQGHAELSAAPDRSLLLSHDTRRTDHARFRAAGANRDAQAAGSRRRRASLVLDRPRVN